jgi:RNA polymerase sigma-70 factor, ECF subfamily
VVFVMFELDEMSCDEIASALGVPVGTVHSRLFTARKLFQKAMLAIAHARGHQEGHT